MKDQEFKEIGRQVVEVAKKAMTEMVDFVSQQAHESDLCQRVVEGASDFKGVLHPLPVRLYETGAGYVIEVEVPGRSSEDIDVVVNEKSVTIRVAPAESTHAGLRTIRDEFSKAPLERVVRVPVSLDADSVEASLSRGVLTLKMGLTDGRRINITEHEE